MIDERALAQELVETLSTLIALPSPYPPGDTTEICAYVARRLIAAGYRAEVLSRKPGIDNVIAAIGSGAPNLVFNAHADTVGVGDPELWRSDPFRAHVADGLVTGLGAGNCKASLAVHLWIAEEVARRGGPKSGTITFTFVGDEESLGPDGMAYLRETGKVKPDYLILGAQTENQLVTAERGVLWVGVETRGHAAHAGAPQRGDNAIARMVRIVVALEQQLMPRLEARRDGALVSTVNIGLIHGGQNTNVVPNACSLEIDRRLLPSESVQGAFAEIAEIIAESGEPSEMVTVKRLRGTKGFSAPRGGALAAAFGPAIQVVTGQPMRFVDATGVSDGRYFADDNIEIVNFGPGCSAHGHTANESAPIHQMVDAAKIQLLMIANLLAS
jgi:acetylornithine deacetylase/succinyl-diaminopimelate desuccinylase family protein